MERINVMFFMIDLTIFEQDYHPSNGSGQGICTLMENPLLLLYV